MLDGQGAQLNFDNRFKPLFGLFALPKTGEMHG